MSTPNPPLRLLEKKIFFSAFVQYFGKAIQFVLAALTLKLISNFLSVGNYGIYATITEYGLFFSMIANLGIFATIIRRMSVDPTDGKIFMNSMYLRVISALIFFALGVIFAFATGSTPIFILGTSLFLGVLLVDFMTSVCDGMLQANYIMGRATFALVIGKLVTFGILYGMIAYIGADPLISEGLSGITLILIALLAGSIITFLMSFYFVVKKIQLNWKIDREFMWTIFKAGIPFGIISIINSLYFRFLPDYFSHLVLTDTQFATFNISFRIAQVLSLFSTFLMFSALPGLREYIDQKHWQKLRLLYTRICIVLAGTGVLLVIFGSLLGPTVLKFLTHEKYFLPEFWYIFPLMLLLAAISYGYDLVLITLFAFDKTKWLLSRECIALTFALCFFGVSYLVPGVHGKILAIILGAIAGEGTMVVWGLLKIGKILHADIQKVQIEAEEK